MRTLVSCALLALTAQAVCGEEDFVPFVIPLQMAEDSQIKLPASPPIPTGAKRLTARDGHFYAGDRRVRIWGVNLCFGANFPAHADAEKVAKRMADFGINSVRFHHMDSTAFPRGIWAPKDPMKLSAEALDRLDYFIDRLARRGIYTNLNLHVSRTHSRYLDLPDHDKLRGYDKMVDLFTPALIDAQKRYARELLTHMNRYREIRYADDPAVAFVEISNEDSLFMWAAGRHLRSLPPYYAEILTGKWQEWLKVRYGTTAKLRAAWSEGAQPLGENLLAGVGVRRAEKKPGWWLGAHHGCEATVLAPNNGSGVRISIAKADGTDWHIQFMHPGLKVKKGRYYTVRFEARAERPRTIEYDVGQDHEPWRNLGLRRAAKLGEGWQGFTAGFTATADEGNARVCFNLAGSDEDVYLRKVQLRPGGRVGLAESEGVEQGNVSLFAECETEARALDRMVFFAETEKAFYDGMREFIRNDLGCKALVTGTIAFGPLGLWAQSGMDYIDGHAYWQHPRFPGRPWDPGNWLVNQEAMVDHPDESPPFRLAASRLAGKPFTVSEYNHPAPNDYQAECVPMIASFAAAQDWDGVWLFAYSHRADAWDREHFSSFFDMQANPAKWGFVPAGTMIFREGMLPPLKGVRPVDWLARSLPELAALHALGYPRMFDDLGGEQARLATAGMQSDGSGALLGPGETTSRLLEWMTKPDFSIYHFRGGGAIGSVSTRQAGSAAYAVTLCALDGKGLPESKRLLLTICGRCENTGMVFSKDRRTVGRNWGKAPTRIEAIEVSPVAFAVGSPVRCYALKPDGSVAAEVEIEQGEAGAMVLKPSPRHRSMWYLLVRETE